MNLELLAAQAQTCTACPLASTRTRVVFGEGHPDAKLMIIGEGPGEEEDKTGRPFVGRAGQLLDRILEAAGIARESVYITNIVKCRPPGNRVPAPDEAKTCTSLWLNKQLELIRPQIIVPLGATACELFLGEKVAITKIRGQWLEWQGIKVMPMLHPAYLLRNPARTAGSPKALTWQDIQEVKRALDALGPKQGSSIKTVSQESLF
ncbi:uracil-DNA glycosylase [Meiothermus granaticius]|uniref:Type-4 uracil-DNA glycosylase n=1 Tax=Meiothermus granaticius NBRC 107808 TaxID=1227551 RepID=A0A399FDR3_9DEIN|nr:uracil-DNA glycosylase [Meiothermus granaticius]MCL6527191.1 uracil-DNA glycosylase [Thermaceae bacterium]RIH93956.1 uracil-DNA glycosylase, family 4 [Meiothermus granaticius NBRC 107808]GEM87798.1 uracil-DNA glycosylase [Meiothermus granaticius NBRC 107808]